MNREQTAALVRNHASAHGVHTTMALAMLAAALRVDPSPLSMPRVMRSSKGRSYDVREEVDADVLDCFRNSHSPMDRCCTGGCDLCEGT